MTPNSAARTETIELEFVCRCHLRRRRGGRRRHASGITGDPTAPSYDSAAFRATRNESIRTGDSNGVEDEDEDEGEAEPEAAATVRLRAAGGDVLGEVWAELPGAPEGWARYPLYAPGAAAANVTAGTDVDTRVSSGEADEKGAGLDRGEVIPAPPGTLRRRWGWGGSKIGQNGSVSAIVGYRPWFRPHRPRDVAGEVKLRLKWVPSGLAVTVHRCREIRPEVEAKEGSKVEASLYSGRRPSVDAGAPRRLMVVSVEPGGGSADAHPVVMETEIVPSTDPAPAAPSAADMIRMVEAEASGLRNKVSCAEAVVRSAMDTDEKVENFFFVLDPACLLSEADEVSIVQGGGNDFDSGGGGARIVLSTEDEGRVHDDGIAAADTTDTSTQAEDMGIVSRAARAELLLFPGADPARRWVPLTDRAGQATQEIDISVGWTLTSPVSLSYDGDDNMANEAGEAVVDSPSSGEHVAMSKRASREKRSEVDEALASVEAAASAAATAGLTRAATMAAAPGAPSTIDAANSGERDDTIPPREAERRAADVDEEDDEVVFPEPAQVVARCVTMRASDLVLRVSDLDVAVLVTMAKGIVQVRVCGCENALKIFLWYMLSPRWCGRKVWLFVRVARVCLAYRSFGVALSISPFPVGRLRWLC